MKGQRFNTEGKHLEVKDLKELLATLPDNAKLFFPCAGRRLKVSKLSIAHDKHTRLLQEGEDGYVHGLANETYDNTIPDHVTVIFDISNPLCQG